MGKVTHYQSSFNAGEFSDLLAGHTDSPRRASAVNSSENLVMLEQGPATRRPGTTYVKGVKFDDKSTCIYPFQYSRDQAYVLEVGHKYIRIYKQGRPLVDSSGSVYEVVSPYEASDLFDNAGVKRIRVLQSADILYMFHGDYMVRKLIRLSESNWSLETLVTLDGAYYNLNRDSDNKLTVEGTTGVIKLTFASTKTINSERGFSTKDVGRSLRVKDAGAKWRWGVIKEVLSTTVIKLDLKSKEIDVTKDIILWRLGLWSEETGYPTSGVFHNDRLCVGGVREESYVLAISKTSEHDNFEPTSEEGVVADDNGAVIVINSDKVNAIEWLKSTAKGLVVGTRGGIWIVSASRSNDALTPSNMNVVFSCDVGTSQVQCIGAYSRLLYIQNSLKRVIQYEYSYEIDGFKPTNLTLASEHITGGGVIGMVYQQEPHTVIWGWRKDGSVLGLTYDPDQKVYAWHKHIIGGFSDEGKTLHAVVEDMVVIPSANGSYDEVWLVVRRFINGDVVRYIETLGRYSNEIDLQSDMVFIDSCISYDGQPTDTLPEPSHLKGEVVQLLVDGGSHPPITVNGEIKLDGKFSKIHIGLQYEWSMETLSPELQLEDGTSQGRTKRISHIVVGLYKSLGLKYGTTAKKSSQLLVPLGIPMGKAPYLITGSTDSLLWSGGYSKEPVVHLGGESAFPITIMSLVQIIEVS